MSLVEFLLARIAEEEAQARTEVIQIEPGDVPEDFPNGWLSRERLTDDSNLPDGTSDYILTWSPRRVLAECEAKRRIVERARDAEEDGEHALQTAEEYARAQALEDVCELLAVPYADHPDYDQAWRPL